MTASDSTPELTHPMPAPTEPLPVPADVATSDVPEATAPPIAPVINDGDLHLTPSGWR